jgi:hypothetical protein
LFSLGGFLKITERNSANFGATYFHGTSYALILTKQRAGLHLGDVFTNSSGHPEVRDAPLQAEKKNTFNE